MSVRIATALFRQVGGTWPGYAAPDGHGELRGTRRGAHRGDGSARMWDGRSDFRGSECRIRFLALARNWRSGQAGVLAKLSDAWAPR